VNIETLREHCIGKPGVTESFPCDPELAVELREQHNEVQPGYHMNKKHWNTVHMNGALTDKQLRYMIDHSYKLVFESLPKKLQGELTAEK
jgi:predicted DNA-binding protein (MmcQ/YjbR family)